MSNSVPSYVYFIRVGDDGPIKIGWSADPRTRLQDLQIGNPLPLKLIDVIPGGDAEESELHSRLNRYRIGGEWFSPVPEVLRLIEETIARFPDECFEIGEGIARAAAETFIGFEESRRR